MRVVLTAPVLRSGVLTHVCDLANILRKVGMEPCLALPNQTKDSLFLLKNLSGIPYSTYVSVKDLLTLAEKHQAKLIHAHSPMTLGASLETAKTMSVPLVITLHGIIAWTELYAEAMMYATHIIATGPEVAKSAGVEHQHKTSIILNGVNLERFKPAACSKVDTAPLRVLYFGRTKGSDALGLVALDQAVDFMRRQGRKVEAWIVGHAAGVFAGSFTHYGWLDDPLPLLQRGHVTFGRGRSLREAMACRNVGFLLGQGYGGMLCQERFSVDNIPSFSASLKHGAREPDAQIIASELSKLDDNRLLLQALQKDARQIAECYFDSSVMGMQTVAIYEKFSFRG